MSSLPERIQCKVQLQQRRYDFVSLCHVGVVYYVCLLCLFAATAMW